METKTTNLPSNLVEVCDYVGQDVCNTQIDEQMADEYDFDAGKRLVKQVNAVRMDYPFAVVPPAQCNVYKIPTATTWGELVKAIKTVCIREYEAGNNAAPHALEDYIIERILIHPNDCATVHIGS